ncbi:hypothetical protein NDU88_003747 [Pleurodeles waltl]|uniref:Uncharacterized protein n=1 Tax=Pleurodeles waltl TaxID=8319 RepID=A0AAV7VGV7_PLEWA|nr:hypothetical protein NDU88_003747 [Pleurodeles waltl]
MVKSKTQGLHQSNEMDNYAIIKQTPNSSRQDSTSLGLSEPSLGAIIVAISDLKSTLEPKLDTVMADVFLLRTDLQKMADKMSAAEFDIQMLRSTAKSLEEQVRTLTLATSNNDSQAGGPGGPHKTE